MYGSATSTCCDSRDLADIGKSEQDLKSAVQEGEAPRPYGRGLRGTCRSGGFEKEILK